MSVSYCSGYECCERLRTFQRYDVLYPEDMEAIVKCLSYHYQMLRTLLGGV